jgi:four helix bundle protein
MVLKVEDLDVYKMAEELADKIWYTCIKWDYFAKETIGKQMVQAADSISTNLAEGHGRFHFKDRLNFCYFARGSLEETKSWLLKAERRGLMNSEDSGIEQLIEVLPKKLNAYIGSIKRTTQNVKVGKRSV